MTIGPVLLDANVLYPAPMRDLLLQLAVDGQIRARWTNTIQQEWIEALLRNEPHRRREALERTREIMNAVVRDALITDHEVIIPTLQLPDSNDRHVLAAAIVGDCQRLITLNERDFPPATLLPYGIRTQHPDSLIAELLSHSPDDVCSAIRKIRARLGNPPYSVDEYLDTLGHLRLSTTVQALRNHAERL